MRSEAHPLLTLATGNRHKVEEIRALLGIPLRGLSEVPDAPEVVEDGETFEANALKKAVSLATHTGAWALADDSGLEVRPWAAPPGCTPPVSRDAMETMPRTTPSFWSGCGTRGTAPPVLSASSPCAAPMDRPFWFAASAGGTSPNPPPAGPDSATIPFLCPRGMRARSRNSDRK